MRFLKLGFWLCLLCALGTASVMASNQDDGYQGEIAALEKRHSDCWDQGGRNSKCLQVLNERQDQLLNIIWKELKAAAKAYSPRGEMVFKSLLDEQRAWLKYRDSACDVYRQIQGTLWLDVASGCRFDIVQDRLKQLESYRGAVSH